MPAVPRQRRYDQVMGDRDAKVTDKRFVQELQQKLEDRYLVTQGVKEKKLADAETRRVRKLVLDGVIEADRKSQGDSGKGLADDWKEFWPPNPHKTLAEYQEEEKRRKAEESRQSQQDHGAAGADEAEASPSDEDAGAAGGDTAVSSEPPPTSARAAAATAPIGRYEGSQSPRIEDLMSEEDLDQLYTKAADIVYIMAPPPRKAAKTAAGR